MALHNGSQQKIEPFGVAIEIACSSLSSRGKKSRLRDETEPAVFVPEVAKQHYVFAGAIVFGVFVSARASFWLDKKIRKLFECFHEDLPKCLSSRAK